MVVRARERAVPGGVGTGWLPVRRTIIRAPSSIAGRVPGGAHPQAAATPRPAGGQRKGRCGSEQACARHAQATLRACAEYRTPPSRPGGIHRYPSEEPSRTPLQVCKAVANPWGAEVWWWRGGGRAHAGGSVRSGRHRVSRKVTMHAIKCVGTATGRRRRRRGQSSPNKESLHANPTASMAAAASAAV